MLFKSRKWDVAVENIFIYGFVFTIGCLVIGFLLAVLIDQKFVEKVCLGQYFCIHTAMSFVVTGLVWKWVLNPTFGFEHSMHLWVLIGLN